MEATVRIRNREAAIRDELSRLGFPFGDPPAQARWARQKLLQREIARTAQSELVSKGMSVREVADTTLGPGTPLVEVYRWLATPEEYFGDEDEHLKRAT
jgi:hypothetical protein